MIKIFIFLFLPFYLLSSTTNIEKRIQQNKKILNTNIKEKETTTQKIKELADKIEAQNNNISNLEKDIALVNSDISSHKKLLEESEKKLAQLKEKSFQLLKEKDDNEKEIISVILEEFSTSLALKLASKTSLQEIIDTEIFELLSKNAKQKVTKLNNNYKIVSKDALENQESIKKLSSYINDREKKRLELNGLKEKHSASLSEIEKQHKDYQVELNNVVKKQDELNKLLSDLNIIKEAEAKKAKEEALKKSENLMKTTNERNQQFAKSLNLDVKKIGSSTNGIKIVKYTGEKTIPPIKSFKVERNFGTYYDPIYKIKLFNESIILKPNSNDTKVVSVLNGKVVYAKKNSGLLDNVVIIQHNNGLHTIYSHLDEIAPTLSVGKWIQKGSVVGRISNSLSFQVTKDSSHIDPRDLFKI